MEMKNTRGAITCYRDAIGNCQEIDEILFRKYKVESKVGFTSFHPVYFFKIFCPSVFEKTSFHFLENLNAQLERSVRKTK